MRDPERDLANRIREEVRELRARLAANPEANPLIWPLPAALALAQRPLRDHPIFGGSGQPLLPQAGPLVLAWVERIRGLGIRSVLCLMHPKELRYYEHLDEMPSGLFDVYRAAGLSVSHIPWADPAHAATPEARDQLRNRVHEIKVEAYREFLSLEKPVVLQCSAGIDRSTPVAAHIAMREHPNGAA